jgi:hypothetical protein
MLAKYITLFLLALGSTAPLLCSASGIAVNPANLSINVSAQKSGETFFTVSNPDSDTQVFEIYSDELTGFLQITPQVFSLSPGSSKQISLKVSPEVLSKKNLAHTRISVIGHPLSESNLQVATGAKLNLNIVNTSAKNKPSDKNILIGLVALGSLLAAAAWQKLKQ